jgi:hypothetical protein
MRGAPHFYAELCIFILLQINKMNMQNRSLKTKTMHYHLRKMFDKNYSLFFLSLVTHSHCSITKVSSATETVARVLQLSQIHISAI